MASEWPIDAPPVTGRRNAASGRQGADGDRRLAAVLQDFFLPAETRLTEQERALMTAMLHGLIGRIAEELRARLDPGTAEACAAEPAELVGDLSRAGLLQEPALIGLLLRRADVQRLAARASGGRTRLQRWTASPDAEVAAAAMALITARGRRRDRFGRAALDLVDCPSPLAANLVEVVAAALGRRCSAPSDAAVAAAAADLLSENPPEERLEDLEQRLAFVLAREGEREPNLLVELAREGEAPLLAAILADEAGIPAEEGWRCLLGGGEQVALLLRMAAVAREEAAALLAHAGPALGIGDPVKAIDRFEALDAGEVQAARAQLALPPGYRRAQAVLALHG
jgi:hypothetical protein